MALPLITLPGGVPNFVAASQEVTKKPAYSDVPFGTGHSRARRLRTAPPRVVRVASKKLTQAQMAALDDWYENALLVGARSFSVLLSNLGPGERWWQAYWIAKWTSEPADGRWVITGELWLAGEGSVDGPPNTSLAVEFVVPVAGSALIVGETPLALEIVVALRPNAPLAVEFLLPVALPPVPIYLQREDGSFYQREDGSYIKREESP